MRTANIIGRPYDCTTIFVDMDGVLAEWQVGKDSQIYDEGYFESLPANMELIKFLRQLEKRGMAVKILSAYLDDSKYALLEKMRWVKKYTPSYQAYFVPCGESKVEYIKKEGFTFNKDLILLDDHSANLIEWDNAGGRAIKFINGINGRGLKWKGERTSTETLSFIF